MRYFSTFILSRFLQVFSELLDYSVDSAGENTVCKFGLPFNVRKGGKVQDCMFSRCSGMIR